MGKKKGKAPLMPKGTGAIKRTPSTHFDEVSGDQLWKPEEVQGEKQAVNRCPCSLCKGNKGKTERYYLIKWKDHDKKHNTWECAAHIAGNEQLVKDYRLRLEKKNKEIDEKKAEKAKAKAAAEQKKKEYVPCSSYLPDALHCSFFVLPYERPRLDRNYILLVNPQ